MTLPGLTDKEQRTFNFIRSRAAAGRVAPTLREIAQHLNLISRSNAHRVVSQLNAKGYIRHSPHSERGIVITPDGAMYAILLPSEVNRRLHDHIAVSDATPEGVIVKAIAEYLARQL